MKCWTQEGKQKTVESSTVDGKVLGKDVTQCGSEYLKMTRLLSQLGLHRFQFPVRSPIKKIKNKNNLT